MGKAKKKAGEVKERVITRKTVDGSVIKQKILADGTCVTVPTKDLIQTLKSAGFDTHGLEPEND